MYVIEVNMGPDISFTEYQKGLHHFRHLDVIAATLSTIVPGDEYIRESKLILKKLQVRLASSNQL